MSNKLTSGSILILVITTTILYKYCNVFFIVGISTIIIIGIVKAINRIKYLRSSPFSLNTQSKSSLPQQNQGEIISSNREKLQVDTQGLKSIQLKANKGDAQAQFELGMIYDKGYFSHGQGILQNTTEAAKWYRLAADNGHATAQYNLGWMYYDGHGVKQDYGEALRLIRLAKKNGMPDTQARLDMIMRAEECHSEALKWQQLKEKQEDTSIVPIRNSSKDEVHASIEELEALQRKEISASFGRNEVTTPLTEGEYKVIIAAEKLKQAKIKVEIAAEKLKQAEIRAKIKSNSQPLLSTLLSKEMRAVCQNSPEQSYSGAPSKRDTLAENVDVKTQFELGKINNTNYLSYGQSHLLNTTEAAIKSQIANLLKAKIRFVTHSIFSTMLAKEMRTRYQIPSVENYVSSPSEIDVLPKDSETIMNNVPKNNSINENSTQKAQTETILSADDFWVPFGNTIEFAGYTIPDGLVYFGTGLKSITKSGEEPSLIDITLPVDKADPDITGKNMTYWPNYSHIHPTSRAAYLEWHSSGRQDPEAHIGYVFLFFYGLERRALADIKESNTANNDLLAIIKEVKRLLTIYRENISFDRYANKFLHIIQFFQSQLPLYQDTPQITYFSLGVSLKLQVALGQMAMDNIPLPVEWALSWVENDQSMPCKNPSRRCPEEFKELFRIRYNEKFKTGLKLIPNTGKLHATYIPASPSFAGYIKIPIQDLPDLTNSNESSSQIREFLAACNNELESYSRFLGRNPNSKKSIEAISYLPQPLLKKCKEQDLQKLVIWFEKIIISDTPVLVSFQSLLSHMPYINKDFFSKKEALYVANFICKINIGIEPDLRFGAFIPNPKHNVVLFRISDNAPIAPSNEYSVATLVLHLASAVATADGTVNKSEKQHLEDYLETCLHLSLDDKIRLQAHMLFLLSSFPDMNNVKKRIELLQQEQKESLAKFLVCIAQADGYIDVAEMKILTRIYAMLGLDAQSLYSHVHTAAVEPVAVQTADSLTSPGYSIPAPPKISDGISLDMDKIKTIRAEDNAISSILHDIFSEDQHEQITTLISDARTTDIPITGLDPESFAFMKELACKLIWTREELEKLAAVHSLMLDGTLESINDASLDHFGDLFFEGDDPVIINAQFAKEINV